jgi:hypothetical protein
MKHTDGATIASGISLALATIAMLVLLFWANLYQGTSSTAVAVVPGTEVSGTVELLRETQTNVSLVEANGRWVISLILFPVVLAAIGLLAAVRRLKAQSRALWRLWRTFGWTSGVLLMLFSLAGAASIGMFFIPAAVAAIVGAVLGRNRAKARAHYQRQNAISEG